MTGPTVDCTCGAFPGGLHAITCMTVAAVNPHTMVDDGGDLLYPDSVDEARELAGHGFRFLGDEQTALRFLSGGRS